MAFVTKLVPGLLSALPKLKDFAKSMSVGVGRIPRGEIGLVIVAVGLSRGLITEPIYVEITGMVILTSIIAPILLTKVYEGIEIETPLE